ncbi:PTS sugar transporter subunit IIC [Lacticaseibacillus pabuli]|uniref:Permease IIC component n=1 Tax=Lacticaseibacillus pabuli TaxID=3025672 RepID=A0ABY7WRQ8_9LACO|nr:PTS sugar transporter subunit IIC [Lacticaseibacillus sp. KACC 23028]WDF82857.1 PTS sugar transporter subunit IIC [Lacticaseibacillus sp. KACC 23028]
MNSSFMNDKVLPRVMKFTNSKIITALKNGMIYTIPFIIVGSVFLLLATPPIASWAAWMNTTGLVPYWNQAVNFSFNMMAVIAVMGISYEWARNEKVDPFPAGITGLLSFLIVLQPTSPIMSASGKVLVQNPHGMTGFIDTSWLAGRGMIAAIIIGLITGWIYSWFVKNKITIKLPEQVPANVANSFIALIPAAVLIVFWLIVYMLFDHFAHTSMLAVIYNVIQTPLQGITDSFGGVLLVPFFISFLWMFGVHGSSIVSGIMTAILLSNGVDNAKLYKAGTLSLGHGAHVFTQALLDQFGTVTGAGITIGLVVYMLWFAKSEQMKALAKLEIAPALFNINEPIIFGVPIVLNPILAAPFILAPMASMGLTYWAIKLTIIPPFNGVYVPWTTPPIMSGFLVGGWKTMLWQALMLVMTFFIYFPFARNQDNLLYKQEQENLAAEEAAKTAKN